uniref:Uncharacterized protein n=1 Tax=Rhizophora mucronata TaxID=61149 RepID=A0A2P2LBX3_RHIMU
MLDPTHLVMSS